MSSWIGKMRKIQAEMAARNADPWRVRLERLRGKIGDDGIERIARREKAAEPGRPGYRNIPNLLLA